jgi:alpha-methylacyl-CoA racemase
MSGPLAGIRIVEMAGIGPGPFAGMMLADHGAEVIRICRPDAAWNPADILLRSRQSITLDMKNPAAVDVARRLIAGAAGLIEGYRPGVMERMGLGPERLLKDNPSLVYGRMTGWGQTGSFSHAAGHDINYIALAGALHTFGRAGEKPTPPINMVGDFGGGGMMLAFGMVSALLHAAKTGEGQVIDCAMTEGAAYVMTANLGPMQMGWWTPKRGTNLLDGGAHFYNTYETADGGYVTFGGIEPPFYADMLKGLGFDGEDLPDQLDEAHWPAMRQKVADRVRTRTRDEWVAVFADLDACFAPVLPPLEAPRHPHHVARGAYTDVGGLTQVAPVPHFSRTPGQVSRPGSHPGQHSAEMLAEWGFDETTLGDLLDRGVVQQNGET